MDKPGNYLAWVNFIDILAAIPDADFAELLIQGVKINKEDPEGSYFIAENFGEWLVINEKKLLDFDPKKAIDMCKKFGMEISKELRKQYLASMLQKAVLGDEYVWNNTISNVTVMMITRLLKQAFSTQKLYHRERDNRTQLTLREKVQEIKNEAWWEIKNPYLIKAIRNLSKEYPQEDLLDVLKTKPAGSRE